MKRATTLTAVSGVFVQIVRPLVTLVTLPILFEYLGEEGLGIWFLALSLIGLINFVSAGLSAGIITHVGRLDTDKNPMAATEVATIGFLIGAFCALLLFAVVLPVNALLQWGQLLSIKNEALSSDVGMLFASIVFIIGFSFIAVVPRQIIFGRLHGYIASSLDLIGVLVGALGLLVAVQSEAPIWVIALLFSGIPPLILLLGGLIYLNVMKIKPFSLASVGRSTFQKLKNDVFRMSGYQIAFSVSSQSDVLLIGLFLGAPEVAVFGMAHRAFSIISMMCLTVNYALWPTMARMDANGDEEALKKLFRVSLIAAPTIGSALSIVLLLHYPLVISLWVGEGSLSNAGLPLLWGMIAWVFVSTAVYSCDSLLRARNQTSFLMKAMMAMAVVNLILTVFLIQIIGAAGAIWGSVLAYAFVLLIPYLWSLRSLIRRD